MGILIQGAAHMFSAPKNPPTLQQPPLSPQDFYTIYGQSFTLHTELAGSKDWKFLNRAEKS